MLGDVDAFELGVAADPEADRLLEQEAQDECDDERVRQHREGADGLVAQEGPTTAVEQALHAPGVRRLPRADGERGAEETGKISERLVPQKISAD